MTFRHRGLMPLFAIAIAASAALVAAPAAAFASTLPWTLRYVHDIEIRQDAGLPIPLGSGFNSVSFADAYNGYAVGVLREPADQAGGGTSHGLLATTSSGGTFWTVDTASLGSVEYHAVLARSDTDVFAVGNGGTIAHLKGSDWLFPPKPTGWGNYAFRAIAFCDENNGWAVGDGYGIAKTVDGGNNWTLVAAPGAGPAYRSLARRNSTSVVAVGDGGRLQVLSTSGAEPVRTIAGVNLYGVTFSGAHGWAVGDGPTVLRTDDGGVTWAPTATLPLPDIFTEQDRAALPARAVAFYDARNGVVTGGYQSVWRTADGGDSWEAGMLEDPTYSDYYRFARAVAFVPGSPDVPVVVERKSELGVYSGNAARIFTGLWSDHAAAAPPAPAGVTLSDGGAPGARIRVTWTDNSIGEKGFVVERAAGSVSGPWSQVTSVATDTTSWLDTTLLDWQPTYYYRVRAFNDAGASAWATSTGLRLDSTPPVTTAEIAEAYVASADISLVATDGPTGSGVAQTKYSLDGGEPVTGSTVRVASLGSHTLEYWSVDAADNEETPHNGPFRFAVVADVPGDSTPPTTTASVADGAFVATTSVSLSATDGTGIGVANTYWILDNGTRQTGSSITGLSQGQHTLEYWSVDAKGNTEENDPVTFTVDTVAPATGLSAYSLYLGSANIALTPSDAAPGSGLASTRFRLNGGPEQWGTTVNVTAVGDYTLDYWSVDRAGNVESAHRWTFAVRVATGVSITSNKKTVTRRRPVRFSGHVRKNLKKNTHVVLYARKPGSSTWVKVKTIHSTKTHHWSYSYSPKTKGTWYFQVRYNGSSTYGASVSSVRRIRVK